MEPNPDPCVGMQFRTLIVQNKSISSLQWLLCSAEEDTEKMTGEAEDREKNIGF
jgi:D-alanine-D-alanine ligase-like ATP-grasp enzyme